jgi:acetyl-CoA carboxylase carboxyl transferase subunit alpha
MDNFLDFEYQVAQLYSKIQNLEESRAICIDVDSEINGLNLKYTNLLKDLYKNLTPWQTVLVSRHQDRPKGKDYIDSLITNFTELQGDRLFADDKAIIGGIGYFNKQSVVVIAIEKGNDIETRIKHNFGMSKPEGYRKAVRLMHLANKFKLPIITFVDTAGAYPGLEAEERGQGEAIARSTAACLEIETPMINVIVSEGGSGGAVALSAGDYIMMLEHSIYSVISPEGCASILWHNDKMAEKASESLKLTAKDLLKYNIIDKIIKEPIGGAHRNKEATMLNVSNEISFILNLLLKMDAKERKQKKHERFLSIGKL